MTFDKPARALIPGIAVSFVMAISFQSSVAASEQIDTIGEWDLYFDKEDPEDINCWVWGPQAGDASVAVEIDQEQDLWVYLFNEVWDLGEDSVTYNIEVGVDSRDFGSVEASASGSTLRFYVGKHDSSFLDALKKGYRLKVYGRSGIVTVRLDGSARALTALERCARRYVFQGNQRNPFASNSQSYESPAEPTNPFAGGSLSSQPPAEPQANPDDAVAELVSTIYGQSELNGPQFLNAAELEQTNLPDGLTAWKYGEVGIVGFGSVVASEGPDPNLDLLAGNMEGDCDAGLDVREVRFHELGEEWVASALAFCPSGAIAGYWSFIEYGVGESALVLAHLSQNEGAGEIFALHRILADTTAGLM